MSDPTDIVERLRLPGGEKYTDCGDWEQSMFGERVPSMKLAREAADEIVQLRERVVDLEQDVEGTDREIVRLREALTGRTVSCSQCNASAAEIMQLQNQLDHAVTDVNERLAEIVRLREALGHDRAHR